MLRGLLLAEICPGLHAAAKIPKFAKNWEIHQVSEN